MIMNALIGVYSDTYILHTIIQEELQKLTKILQKKTNFKDMNFPVKIRNILKVEKKKKKKKNSIAISVFGYENKEK